MSNARPVKVESLQLLTLQESALKEELLHLGESLQHSLGLVIDRLKDACSAESIERGGGWLLEHVWRFCDALQEFQKSLRVGRNTEAIGDTFTSVRRRRSGLMEELQHQIQCEKDLEHERQEAFLKEQQLQQRLEKCKEEIVSLKSRDRSSSVEALTLEVSLQEASRFQKLDAEFKDVLASAETQQRKEKDAVLQQLAYAKMQLQQLAQQASRLRQLQRTLDGSLRAELNKGKETMSRCGAALVEGAAAGCRQMSAMSVAAQEHVEALQARLVARQQAGVEQLERQQKEALAVTEQAEQLKKQATQEISRLLHEQSISEKQRSANAANASKTSPAITQGCDPKNMLDISYKTVRLATEATQARTCVLVDERERLESLCGAERLFEAQQSLKEALSQNEQLRRDLDLARLREQQSHADAADADATEHRKKCEEIQQKEQAELDDAEKHLSAQEAKLVPLSTELVKLKMQMSKALTENMALERERALWRAQCELQQKLRQEVQQGMEQSRAAWSQERCDLEEDISRGSEKIQRLKADVAAAEASETATTWSEERQLEQELQEVERCLGAVTSTLAQRSRRSQQSDADARLQTVWQRLDRLQHSMDLERRDGLPWLEKFSLS